jgi:tRNA pseudouridine38-40 synthase
MRYFIHIGYDCTSYSCCQRQKNTTNTIQEIVQKTLTHLLKKKVYVHGCGRTDAGVHASQYVLQIDLDKEPQFDLKFRLNKNLPDEIAVFEVIEVNKNQHCQYDAVARTYDYFIHWNKNPALFRYSSHYEYLSLDFGLMKKATALILATKDFRLLCKKPDSYDNTLCQISNCELFVNEEEGRMRFSITSNRFLRGMIRICVYHMLEVGRGKLTLEEFQEILTQDREIKVKWLAHPNGLFLSRVKYPFLELSQSQNLVRMLSLGLE